MAEFGSFCTSTVSASRSHQLPKRGDTDTTDLTSCALKLCYRAKTEFLPLPPAPALDLSHLFLDAGCRSRLLEGYS